MQAKQSEFLKLFEGKRQFIVPIYQRKYSWTFKQCDRLFNDIINVGSSNIVPSHFIGSVVYFSPDSSPITAVPEYLVIDGQQRLTTISLILLALARKLKQNNTELADNGETFEEILETYLINKHRTEDQKLKIQLTKDDKQSYADLINDVTTITPKHERILENYEFFSEMLNDSNIDSVYRGLRKLSVVDVILELGKDDPQMIFESLNSTGLDLSQADLIRNYVLMGLNKEKQAELYNKYWYPMERSFGESISKLPFFIRDYLTMKQSTIPNINQVYETYKDYLKTLGGRERIEETLEDLYNFSGYYVDLALSKESDNAFKMKFEEINQMKIDVSYPFIMVVYDDYKNGRVSSNDFLDILDVIKNYVFRRSVCGIPTNSLNKTFAILYKSIRRESYLESVKATFLLMEGYKRFPSNSEFKQDFLVRDVYNFRSRNYLLDSLENFGKKELISSENYTIEHVIPQNKEVSNAWKDELGENWKSVKERYLHTIGNLTLTGYNSELSDRPFREKKTIEGGFNSSPLSLNESIRSEERWNEDAILRRARTLADLAAKIWRAPELPEEILEKYRKHTDPEEVYTLEHYDQLKGRSLDLFNNLQKRVLNVDSTVRMECKKLYIAFKSQTNFVDVIPQKDRLRLALNMEFEHINDPKGICNDVTTKGKWGNGDVDLILKDESELDYIMYLIQQSFDLQTDSV